MERATKFALAVLAGVIVFLTSLPLPWESWRGLPLTSGFEIVAAGPLPYMLLVGCALCLLFAALSLLKRIGGRAGKSLALASCLLVSSGWAWGLFKLYELVSEFGEIGRGAWIGSVGVLVMLVGVLGAIRG
jgi:hypothetical protein